jgi:hypothetical protein
MIMMYNFYSYPISFKQNNNICLEKPIKKLLKGESVMGSKTIIHSIESGKPLTDIKEATKKSLMLLGGTVVDFGDGFQVKGGDSGIQMAFVADFESMISIQDQGNNHWNIMATISWSPNTIFWVCLISGFFLVIPWIINILYLFVDPTQAYQQRLFMVNSFLD